LISHSIPSPPATGITHWAAFVEQLLPTVFNAATSIEQSFTHFSRDQAEDKGLNDWVSYVDRQSDTLLQAGCTQLLPQAGFITEETGRHNSDNDWVWIIDPLDGTTNFVCGIPFFSISIALAYQKQIMLGIVYDVIHKECFTAVRGQQAYCNNKPITVGNARHLSQAVIATGFPFRQIDIVDRYLQAMGALMQQTRGMRRLGSAALDLAYTACGRFDGFFETGLSIWDIAAGSLLIETAGGKISECNGNNQFLHTGSVAAANPQLHPQLIRILHPHLGL
jgi:myo-inositol-1(or 4)-monophosphatase